jgi:hypothetical protein
MMRPMFQVTVDKVHQPTFPVTLMRQHTAIVESLKLDVHLAVDLGLGFVFHRRPDYVRGAEYVQQVKTLVSFLGRWLFL